MLEFRTVLHMYFVLFVQKHRSQAERGLTTKEIEMQDLKNTVVAETDASSSSSVNELQLEIMVSLLVKLIVFAFISFLKLFFFFLISNYYIRKTEKR